MRVGGFDVKVCEGGAFIAGYGEQYLNPTPGAIRGRPAEWETVEDKGEL